MLRLAVGTHKLRFMRSVPRFRSGMVIPICSYRIAQPPKHLKAEYDSLTDYGSYKNTSFTHRLPESTADQSPLLVALHARLNLPQSYSLSTLSQALNLNRDDGLANNFGLNVLGKSLLSYYVNEHVLIKYPRLPMSIHNVVVDAYMGYDSLYDIGKHWGVEVDKTSKLKKVLAQEPEFLQYGKLRYLSEAAKEGYEEQGIYELSDSEAKSLKQDNSFVSKESEAYASAVRSIIGGLYTHSNEEVTKRFIDDHILSRQIPIKDMFQFSRPTRELVRLGEKLNFTDNIEIRLIAETGRLSSNAMYVVGVFCGGEKLGEAIGSSLKEARTRAVVNTLMSYYLYSPISEDGSEVKVPSDESYDSKNVVIGLGDVAI